MKLYDWNDREITLESIQNQVGKGWSKIIENLVLKLEALGWNGKVFQVKEKFGGLRFYIGGNQNELLGKEIWEEIAKAELESLETCEECGQPGKLGNPKGGGWIKTLCTEHSQFQESRELEIYKK